MTHHPEAESPALPSPVGPRPLLADGSPQLDVLAAIGRQARQTPDAPALMDSSGRTTYGELVAEMAGLAGALVRAGVRPGDLVGIGLPRGRAAVTALLAVLRAGAGYVPLDPAHPPARLAAMIEDTRPRLVVMGPDDDFPVPSMTLLRLGEQEAPSATVPAEVVDPAGPNDPAYVIFTSGSTGRPKGVLVPRRSWAHFCGVVPGAYGIVREDRVLQFASLGFDASVQEIFPALIAGAAVVVRDEDMISHPGLFMERCAEYGVTVLPMATAYWREVTAALDRNEAVVPPSVRMVVIGGEEAHAGTVDRWRARSGGVRLLNTYGPTEAVVTATVADLTNWSGDGPVPIGHPLPGVSCRVVRPDGSSAADGESGELLLGGAALAAGYLGLPGVTAERFLAGPGSAREYVTGDRVRRLPDGSLAYLGRLDRQVKIRGFRIEPGEVESALRAVPAVLDAVVSVDRRTDPPRLAAHLLVAGDLDAGELRRVLAERIPRHMTPAVFSSHTSFPRTVQGKVDVAALADAPLAPLRDGTAERASAGGKIADRLVELWQDLLGVPGVLPGDDFFALGGDSLQAVRLIGRIREEFDAELTLSGFLRDATPAATAEAIRTAPRTPLPGTAGEAAPEAPRRAASLADPPKNELAEPVAGLPLTPIQRDFWIAEQVAPGVSPHTLGIRYRWTGEADPERLAACLEQLAERQPALRARFAAADGEPRMFIDPAGSLPLTVVDLRDTSPGQRARRAEQERRRLMHQGVDLETGPSARGVLLRTGGDDEFLLVVHHLVFDGWSVGVFADELAALYQGTAAPGHGRAEPANLAWLARHRNEVRDEPVLATYWRDRFLDAQGSFDLPSDRPRPLVAPYTAGRISRRFPPDLLAQVRSCAEDNQATVFMVLLAAVQAVLNKYTGRSDVTVLTPVAGRDRPEWETLIGAVLELVPLRGDLTGSPTFAELLASVRQSVAEDLDRRGLPPTGILAAAGLPPSAADGLSRVSLTVHNTPAPGGHLLRYAGDEAPTATVADLTIGLHFPVDGPLLTLDFAADLYDAERIQALTDHLLTLLRAGTGKPETAVADLPLLDADEERRILHGWNDHAAPLPSASAVHELFEGCVADRPDAPALTVGERTDTYRQVNERANRVARVLRRHGVNRGSRVAICLDRGIDLFVAMWAVWKAGGAYVPLDPAYPAERLRYMLEDSGPVVLLTRDDLDGAPSVPDGVAVLALDRDAAAVEAEDGGDLGPASGPGDPAYVIYTSGSTGRPKGVVVTHANLVHAVGMWQRAYDLAPDWTYQQAASFSFDMFVGETLRALCTGGRLVVVPRETLLAPEDLYRLMRTERVQCTELVPAVLRALLAHVAAAGERLDFVRLLIGGGEKWNVSEYRHARELVGPGNRVVNAYGVTEVTVDNVFFDGDADGLAPEAPLPIGRPFPNNRAYVLDQRRRPVPPGVVGELYLGGEGVASGYHGRPGLTAERFVPDPFAGTFGPARMYRTGDSARYHRDGTIDFLGRLDDQVKVNGYRVELGEVEGAIGALSGVLACAATVRTLPSGIVQLVGYVVPAPGTSRTEQDVRDTLAASLPAHMVPARVVVLPRLPLTPNGKLDRRALPEPSAVDETAATAVPRTRTEQRVAAIWADALGTGAFGVDDSFFALGGDSFTALRIIRRIDPSLALVELYRHPTVRTLAAFLDGLPADDGTRPRPLLYRLSRNDADTAAGGVTVVAVPYSGGSAVAYQPLADALPPSWALRALELPGHDQGRPDEPLLPAFEVADRVLTELGSITGPVLLYGHCLGSAVTLEIARRAEQAGVDLVGVGLGASFPTARLPGRFFDWFYRLIPSDRFVSDREYISYLRARGGFTDLDDPEQERFVLRNVRHDARDAEEYFTAAFQEENPARLRAPVLSVVGARDRVTELYEERHHEWEHFSDQVDLAVLPRAGHFFVKTHPEPLARVLVEHAGRSAAARCEAEASADGPGAAGRRPGKTAAALARGPRSGASGGTAPSLSRFAVVALGQFLSMIGSSLSTLVLGIWVYQRTGSLTEFSVVSAVGMLPGILAGPAAGAIADRWDRRRIMLLSDTAAALGMVSLAVLVVNGGLRMWHIYLVLSVTSLAGAFQRPAYLAAVAQLVPKRYLGHAAGINQLGIGVGAVFAPMLGVGLMGRIGIDGIILIDVLSFLVGAGTLLAIRFPDLLFRRRDEPFAKAFTRGWRYIVHRPGLRLALCFFSVHHILYMIGFSVIIPMVLVEQSPAALGTTLAAGGVGALSGSLAMGLWGGTARRTTGLILSLAISGTGMFLTGLGSVPFLVMVGVFLISFCDSIAEGHWLALVQTKIGFELQGRVLALFTMTMMLTMPLGYLVFGPLAEHHVQPLLEPGGPLAGTVGSVIGTGPGRGLALLVLLSGVLQWLWVVWGWRNPRLRFLEDDLPDAVPPAELGNLDDLQRESDDALSATRS
ncbi:amino acid adenylation domain-containing protein [Streptomyces sp. NPDC087659]|uniref:non-ribosomal peptide synthetase/MFS transporter n=1 Tax=Streptomyces sp. NPDC087659 TaxID=3365801 RepID=UPI0037F95709